MHTRVPLGLLPHHPESPSPWRHSHITHSLMLSTTPHSSTTSSSLHSRKFSPLRQEVNHVYRHQKPVTSDNQRVQNPPSPLANMFNHLLLPPSRVIPAHCRHNTPPLGSQTLLHNTEPRRLTKVSRTITTSSGRDIRYTTTILTCLWPT